MSEAGQPDDEDDDLGDLRELLRKVAAAPSIDPSTLSGGRTADIQGFEPGKRLGHFRIVERIGAGGMGVVYRAEDERLRRSVALKVLPPHQVSDRERRRRMWREAQSAAAVNHPNIAAIYELGEDAAGTVFIAMEYLDGRPLRLSYQDGPVPPREALESALQIAQGLARAHAAGIVHRDLKPDNVMVLPDGAVKILDFGLAKLLAAPEERLPPTAADGDQGSAATKDGQIVGTPRYMSPEQKSGARVDARADVYAFGVMLFELCTGQWPEPFARDQPALERTAEPARARAGAWTPLFDALIQLAAHCVRHAPAERFADGAELQEALRRLQQRFDPGAGRPWRLLRPRRLAQLGGLAALIALAVFGALQLRAPPPAPGLDLESQLAPRILERRLTANPPDNPVLDAALSPDGARLAYVDRSGLFVRSIDPPSTEQVPFQQRLALASVAWLPGERELLISGHRAGEEGVQLWRVKSDGTARRLARGFFQRPRPSPDGERLAWIEPKGVAVGPLEAPRGAGKIIVDAGGDRVDGVCWSPDGKRIAYLRVRTGDQGIEARLESVPAEGGTPTLLLSNPRLLQSHGGGALAWARDGRLLFALADRPPRETGFTLWSLQVNDAGRAPEHPRLLHAWSGSTPGLLTAADQVLAYTRTETQSDAYVADLAEGGRRLQHPRRLTLSDRNEHPTGWSADSAAVIFTSDQDGSDDLFAQALDTGASRRLLDSRAAQTWGTYVGRSLLFWEHPAADGSAQRHRAQLVAQGPGGRTELLTTAAACDHTAGELAPSRARFRCTEKGQCVLGEALAGELVFTRFSLTGGRGEVLARVQNPGRGGAGWDLSRDGQRLAIPGTTGQVKVLELASGRSTDRYLQHGCELEHVSFDPEARGLYATAVCAGDRPYKLLYAELNRSALVLWDSSSTWFGHPQVSPDGRHLTFAVRPHDNDVWLASGL